MGLLLLSGRAGRAPIVTVGWVCALALLVAVQSLTVSRAAAGPPSRDAAPDDAHGRAAGHGLAVTPTRLVLEGARRTGALSVVNQGTEHRTYRVEWVRLRMSESGALTPVDAPSEGEAFSDTLVRFSPHGFDLEPGESQVIRLQLREPPGLPTGEYRSHLAVREVPDAPGAPDASGANARSGVSIALSTLMATAVPVIVRRGATSAALSISEADIRRSPEPGQPDTLRILMTRAGNRSVCGDITALDVSDAGDERVIGLVRTVAIYCPNETRVVRLPIDAGHAGGLRRLRIRFEGPEVAEATSLDTILVVTQP